MWSICVRRSYESHLSLSLPPHGGGGAGGDVSVVVVSDATCRQCWQHMKKSYSTNVYTVTRQIANVLATNSDNNTTTTINTTVDTPSAADYLTITAVSATYSAAVLVLLLTLHKASCC